MIIMQSIESKNKNNYRPITTMSVSRNNLLKLKQLGHSDMSVDEILGKILNHEIGAFKINDNEQNT